MIWMVVVMSYLAHIPATHNLHSPLPPTTSISLLTATTTTYLPVIGLGAALEGGEATAIIVEKEWGRRHCSKIILSIRLVDVWLNA